MKIGRAPAGATADGPAYQGQAGATRTEALHLRQPGGALRTVEVHRVVNVGTHPELRQRVLEGDLHRQPDGSELAIAFVYHDPAQLRFALVIPPSLAHVELKERARLMTELADDAHPVPAYVREGVTVLGIAELDQYLGGHAPAGDARSGPPPAVRPALVMAPSPPARGLLAAKVSLVAGISHLFNQRALRREIKEPGDSAEVAIRRLNRSSHTRRAFLPHKAAPLAASESRTPAPAAPRQGSSTAAAFAAPPVARAEAPVAVPALLATGLSASRPAPRLPPPPPPPRIDAAPARHPRAAAAGVAGSEAAAAAAVLPAGFSGLPTLAMRVRIEPCELLLFVRLDAAHKASFDEDAELMLQSVIVKGRPVVLLGLEGAGRVVARLALDGLAVEARELVSRLQRDFKAQLVLCDGDRARSPRSIFAPREGNAAAIAVRLERHREAPEVSADEACACVLADPPKTHDARWPFAPMRVQAQSPASVLASVAQLEAWLQPDRVEQVLVEHAVPKHVIEAWQRRVLLAARSFGIALPDVLLAFVVEHRLADSRAAWVRAQLAAFKQREERNQNDLNIADAAHNWEQLLAQAQALALEIDPALYRRACEGVPGLTDAVPE
jgi:hypothetical protein